jgi:hypothetical protein
MDLLPIEDVIPEPNIVVFSPHYDDVLFGLGGYILELRAQRQLMAKRFHILQLFSRSNYQAGSGPANFDTSLERIKLATGNRLLEDLDCLDELLGAHQYRYELLGERECFLRDKVFADSEMEFPHGDYGDFNAADRAIFARLQDLVRAWAVQADTALVFPLAIKEHIDHFITREAGITVGRQLGRAAPARFYFQEDKPYAGIQTAQEAARLEAFVQSHPLQPRLYRHHPERVVQLAFKHYLSQVGGEGRWVQRTHSVYRKGVLERSRQLQAIYGLTEACDRLFVLD